QFFPPGLEVVAEQENAHGFSSHAGHQFALHRFLSYQTYGPAGAAFRGRGSLQTMAIIRCFWLASQRRRAAAFRGASPPGRVARNDGLNFEWPAEAAEFHRQYAVRWRP